MKKFNQEETENMLFDYAKERHPRFSSRRVIDTFSPMVLVEHKWDNGMTFYVMDTTEGKIYEFSLDEKENSEGFFFALSKLKETQLTDYEYED